MHNEKAWEYSDVYQTVLPYTNHNIAYVFSSYAQELKLYKQSLNYSRQFFLKFHMVSILIIIFVFLIFAKMEPGVEEDPFYYTR